MAPTIVAARQLVGHGHILVNQAKVDIPSYSCSVKDIISIKIKASRDLVSKFVEESSNNQIPNHLNFNKQNLVGVLNSNVTRQWVGLQLNELLVVVLFT
jgi:small subunit ribosomal protein S4